MLNSDDIVARLEALNLKVGDQLEIPAGTKVWDYSDWPWKEVETKRKGTVVVSHFDFAGTLSAAWEDRLPGVPKDLIAKLQVLGQERYRSDEASTQYQLLVIDVVLTHFKDKLRICWSGGKKAVYYPEAIKLKKADPTPIKPRKEKAVTKRDMLVPNSVWKFVENAVLKYETLDRRTWEFSLVTHPVKAGGEMTIKSKPKRTWSSAAGKNVIAANVVVNGTKLEAVFLNDEVESVIEPVGEIVAKVALLRNRETGKFWSAKNVIAELEYIARTEGEKTVEADIEWVDRLGPAKKFNSIGSLRVWLLGLCGYFDGIDQGVDYFVEAGSKVFSEIPAAWEIVEVDKLTKKVLAVHDIHAALAASYRLRELTVRFGSAVRTVYKNLEKAGKLGYFGGLVVFSIRNGDIVDDGIGGFKAGIEEVITSLGIAPKSVRWAFDGDTAAVAVPDVAHATLARLVYDGPLACSAYDMATLTEIVGEG